MWGDGPTAAPPPMEPQSAVWQQRDPWQPMTQQYEAVPQQWGPSQQWGPWQSQQVPQPWTGQQHPYFHPPVQIPQQHAEPQSAPDHLPPPCPQPPTATAQAPTPQATSAPPAAADPPHLQSTPRPPQAARPPKDTEPRFLGIVTEKILQWRYAAKSMMEDLGRCLARCSYSEVYPATTVVHLFARGRGLNRTSSWAFEMYTQQAT